MLEITCLGCAKPFKVPAFVDVSNYDGQMTCPECSSLLYIKLVNSKVRRYSLLDRKSLRAVAVQAGHVTPLATDGLNVEEIAKYNPFRDFLATYHASQIGVAFEQIEGMIGGQLDTAAYTLRSWWENDSSHPQALAWLEAGWEVAEVVLDQRRVLFARPTHS